MQDKHNFTIIQNNSVLNKINKYRNQIEYASLLRNILL
jgi:hypothetical protein